MKALRTLTFLGVLIAAAAFSAMSTAAQNYTLQPESKLWIDGTSTRSDFTVHANELQAAMSLDAETGVPSELNFTVPSAEIKSNSSTIMDRLMHEALKVSEHPTITYELVEATASGESAPMLKTTGRLTLAGVTNEIEMDVTSESGDDGAVRYTGSTPLKMTDYDMQPPTAMFGSLRTADDVTVSFEIVFAPAN